MLDDVYKDTTQRMKKTVEAVVAELQTVRTGKATPHLLDTVKVEVYGSTMPLNQVGTVAAPEPRLLTIQVFDKATVGDVVKGIQKADLGFNPNVDGQMIRISVPPLNEERRQELVKHCKGLAENGRVAARNIRRDANDTIKQLETDKDISKDQMADGKDEVQEMTNQAIKEIDDIVARKEKDLLEV